MDALLPLWTNDNGILACCCELVKDEIRITKEIPTNTKAQPRVRGKVDE